MVQARGLLVTSHSLTTRMTFLSSFHRLPFSKLKILFMSHKPSGSTCSCSQEGMSSYKEIFSKRMAMTGLRPHHRIALGVSGGPDSMALCVLAAGWKTDGLDAADKGNRFIDGLLAIVVDHGLRAESAEEAGIVHQRVSDMGIRCEIARCEWMDGKPSQGHLQEEARDMRYQIFQKICIERQFSVLLIAHHADDQAELFIMRLSRNSSVLGLAGMAFTSELFSKYTHAKCGDLSREPHGILLVRPLLDFRKEDLYKICQEGKQKWVEDPSNRSTIFVRNRIRKSLEYSSSTFRVELQALLSACRRTRLYVDKICSDLVDRTVTISDQGYAIVDLEALNPSGIEDITLAKFCTIVLQFISQRHRPVRGSTSKLVMDYIRTSPCKTSLTAAGCYLSPAPGSKGTKLVVCCSVNCALPSKMELVGSDSDMEPKYFISTELEEIIGEAESYLDLSFASSSDVHFLNVTSGLIISEAKRLKILSESTYKTIVSLQEEESAQFKPKSVATGHFNQKHASESGSTSQSKLLNSGKFSNFMNRFVILWRQNKEYVAKSPGQTDSWSEEEYNTCKFCQVGKSTALSVRPMETSDWLYLAELSKCQNMEDFQHLRVAASSSNTEIISEAGCKSCLGYAKLSAQQVIRMLKSIPAAARTSLPVLVNPQGVILSIPSLSFQHCPCLEVYCRFNPRVPLGGGHSSFH